MKQAIFFFLITAMFLGASSALRAQSVQVGRVLLYHGSEAKTPLSGVSVSVKDASAVMSGADGLFSLSFRTLRPGDAIQFRRVEMSGYEVMNSEALDVARVSNGNDTLSVVMCDSEELSKLRDGYRTKAAQRYQQRYEEAQNQLKNLQEQGKIKEEEFNRQLEELENNYEAQLQSLDTYVDKFARIDLSELDAFEQEIVILVQEGRFEEAISRYEDQHLTERLQQGVKQQKQLQQDVQTVQTAIEAKEAEAVRLEQNLQKQEELRQKLNGGGGKP